MIDKDDWVCVCVSAISVFSPDAQCSRDKLLIHMSTWGY